jgi:hypothetical protein
MKQSSTVPGPMIAFNAYISNFLGQDQFPMEQINEVFFDYTYTETLIEQFEDLSFFGSNFVILTGQFYVVLVICFVFLAFIAIVWKILLHFYKY